MFPGLNVVGGFFELRIVSREKSLPSMLQSVQRTEEHKRSGSRIRLYLARDVGSFLCFFNRICGLDRIFGF